MIQLATVLRFVDIATDALAGAREEIDALNVYPVPDGDTGTNMYLTVSAARDAIREAVGDDPKGADLGKALAAFSRGALLGARGNSGVILSQMLGAIAHRIAEQQPGERNATVMAEALQQATDASYAAVGEPVEGTILTVARAAVGRRDGARRRPGQPGPATCSPLAAKAAREALARTPEQLKALRDAGVVDAGGRGLSVILDAAETVLTGRRPAPVADPDRPAPRSRCRCPADDLTRGRAGLRGDVPPRRRRRRGSPTLRRPLAPLGDSLVVVGGEGLWNVHVHVDDVGAAIEAGIRRGPAVPGPGHPLRRAGRRRRGRSATDAARSPDRRRRRRPRPGRAVRARPARVVVEGGPGRRPSTGQVLEAITDCGAGGGRGPAQRPRLGAGRRDRRPDRRERRGHDGRR